MTFRYFPALVGISLGLLFVCYLIADIALAHRGSGRRGFPVVIAKIMPGDGRREDDGDAN